MISGKNTHKRYFVNKKMISNGILLNCLLIYKKLYNNNLLKIKIIMEAYLAKNFLKFSIKIIFRKKK